MIATVIELNLPKQHSMHFSIYLIYLYILYIYFSRHLISLILSLFHIKKFSVCYDTKKHLKLDVVFVLRNKNYVHMIKNLSKKNPAGS